MREIKGIIYCMMEGENGKRQEILLNPQYSVKYDEPKNIITVKHNMQYVHDFWGKNIKSCIAVVGENGSGKTVLLNSLMRVLLTIKNKESMWQNGLVLCESNMGECLVFVTSEDLKKIEVQGENIISYYPDDKRDGGLFGKFEMVYIHKVLCEQDYFRQCTDGMYDFSLGRLVQKSFQHAGEMHYNGPESDKVIQYFGMECQKVITFLYDYALRKNVDILFPMPTTFRIDIADRYYNLQYIKKEAKEIHVENNEKMHLGKDIEEIIKTIEKFANWFELDWINKTIQNLLLNCFREYCVPDIFIRRPRNEYKKFLKACRNVRKAVHNNNKNIYECTVGMLQEIKASLGVKIKTVRVEINDLN